MFLSGGTVIQLADFREAILITKGYSPDRKYRVTDDAGRRYLLRIAPTEEYGRMQAEFAWARKAADLGIPMSEPAACGVCGEGAYAMFTWIDGADAGEVIPTLPDGRIYDLGCRAGEMQRRMHDISAPDDTADWETQYLDKITKNGGGMRNAP